jgi:hypothetical protein
MTKDLEILGRDSMPITCDEDGLYLNLDRDDCGYLKFISSLFMVFQLVVEEEYS